jgi:Kef-type K+ transport system membrane component KefB
MEHGPGVLANLFVLLLAAKIGDEIFKRIGQPPLVGEILAGVIVGPALLGWYDINEGTALFAEIGVVLLLFRVGLETRLADLLRVGPQAGAVGALGILFPFIGGVGLGIAFGLSTEVTVFLAAAMVATSVGVTSELLMGLNALRTSSGRVIIGAAVIDDVLAMIILAVATGIAAGGVSVERIGLLLLVAVGFIVIVVVGGTGVLRRRPSLLTDPVFAQTPFLPGVIIMLGLAALAAAIGLAALIGAFLAGMVVGESSERRALEKEVAPVAAFFTPFFFGAIGAQIDLAGLVDPMALALLLAVTAVAVTTKFLGSFVGAITMGARRAVLVGWGMVPRGEVGIVVAGLGLQIGVIGGSVYSVVVAMAIVTTLIVPPLVPRLVKWAEEPSEDEDRDMDREAAGAARWARGGTDSRLLRVDRPGIRGYHGTSRGTDSR